MRTAFIRCLEELAEQDERVCLVVGDLGYSVVEPFAQRFPDRYVNAGISEQNMTGLAAGMALSGMVVFTYSIANFPTLRCLEQVRNDVCYHRANVKIVAVGGGLAYGSLGVSHHASEDLAIMRAMPEMTVLAPGDPVETRLATAAAAAHEGPCYLRLGKAGEPVVHATEPDFEIGRAIQLRDGDDLTLISTGAMLATAATVADEANSRGLATRLLSMPTIKPLDAAAVLSAARETGQVFTLEEHSVSGGLGSAVAEVMAEIGEPHAPLRRIGLRPTFTERSGTHEYLKRLHGLDLESVLDTVVAEMEKRRGLVG
jgi:transketolase